MAPVHGNFLSLGIGEEYLQGRYPEIAGKYSGLLIIIASARCVWDDLEKAGMVKNEDPHIHRMTINDITMHYPGPIEHVYSNDHRWLPRWISARRELHTRKWEGPKHSHSNQSGGKHTWPWPGHGTSTLNAVYTGLALGYDEIWLCGAPMDGTGHYFDPPWGEDCNYWTNFSSMVKEDGQLRYWDNAARKIFEGRVKSLSGRTMELLGSPKE